jgi:HPt (histidine-containing phosphotransfer) domain-containing protein
MDPAAQPSMAEALDRMWTRFLPQLEERVATLEAVAAAFAGNHLSEDQRTSAIAAAHKLAGVLGTFGLDEGTVLARELEGLYSRQSGPDAALGAQLTTLAARLSVIVESRNQPPPPPQQLHFG